MSKKANFDNIGIQGRRTGVTLKEIKVDEDGMPDFDDMFDVSQKPIISQAFDEIEFDQLHEFPIETQYGDDLSNKIALLKDNKPTTSNESNNEETYKKGTHGLDSFEIKEITDNNVLSQKTLLSKQVPLNNNNNEIDEESSKKEKRTIQTPTPTSTTSRRNTPRKVKTVNYNELYLSDPHKHSKIYTPSTKDNNVITSPSKNLRRNDNDRILIKSENRNLVKNKASEDNSNIDLEESFDQLSLKNSNIISRNKTLVPILKSAQSINSPRKINNNGNKKTMHVSFNEIEKEISATTSMNSTKKDNNTSKEQDFGNDILDSIKDTEDPKSPENKAPTKKRGKKKILLRKTKNKTLAELYDNDFALREEKKKLPTPKIVIKPKEGFRTKREARAKAPEKKRKKDLPKVSLFFSPANEDYLPSDYFNTPSKNAGKKKGYTRLNETKEVENKKPSTNKTKNDSSKNDLTKQTSVEVSTSLNQRSKNKSPKKRSLEEQENREDDEATLSVRRSKRHRIQPLKFWENEQPSSCKDRGINEIVEEDIFDIGDSDLPNSQNEPIKGEVINSNGIRKEIASIYPKIEPIIKKNYKLYVSAQQHPNFQTGLLCINRQKTEPLSVKSKYRIVYFVAQGKVEVTVNHKSHTVNIHQSFSIAPNTAYSIANLNLSESKLTYYLAVEG
ncbi:hypothetical protein K502DRAFT_362435 [Neoconidiobolus thromboides FSU 785]|nr:hypothetical protein K502DRAFT_362435 [Neoconidiobolus thromboides FSU 785]